MSASPKRGWWKFVARHLAREAHEAVFSSRRGVGYLADEKVLYLYDNNPYAHWPTLRDEQIDELRVRLKSSGIQELAFASYPPVGEEQAGYTVALVVAAGEDRLGELCNWWTEIIRNSLKGQQNQSRTANSNHH